MSKGGTRVLGLIVGIVGVLILMSPWVSAYSTAVLVGWLFLIGGIVHLFVGFDGRYTVGTFFRSLLYILVGVLILASPVLATFSLPVILGLLLVIDGIIIMIMSLANSKELKNWGWVFVGGALSIVLGVLIMNNPLISLKTMVLLTGLALIFSGLSMLIAPKPR